MNKISTDPYGCALCAGTLGHGRSKATEIAIFGAAFLILMNIMGISLTSLAVLEAQLVLALALDCKRLHQTSSRA
jgi:uncharacterized membrane protein YdcZ (DUF606 family)